MLRSGFSYSQLLFRVVFVLRVGFSDFQLPNRALVR
ncbi:hypothetical protein SAMN05428962_5211 [Paenibacillus sp. BC26]|nr:hypothetical protein SAMN05428962_5211 [Paenibacillus sp. BC26]